MTELVRLDRGTGDDDGIAFLTVDNPPLNLLALAVRRLLAEYAEELAADATCRAVVLTGAGQRTFSAGSDVREFPTSIADGRARAAEERAGFAVLTGLPQPLVAALHRHVLGGGLELALCADVRVADANASLGFPEAGLGLLPAGGGTQRLPRLVGTSRALWLLTTTDRIDAAEAERIGLVDRVVPAGQSLPAATDLARRMAANPPEAVQAIKAAVVRGAGRPLADALPLEEELGGPLFATPTAQRARDRLLGTSTRGTRP